jgi:ABC-type multidrug transport system ATPase subunit
VGDAVVIAATDVCLVLDGRTILDHLCFRVAPGESIALVGPNGSGKTSVLRCMLGLVPFQGQILIGGHDALRQPVPSRTLLSYMPQKPAFGDATAAEVLSFTAQLRRLERGRVGEVLRTVGLEAQARQRVRTFSGGMQQRLSMAVALLAETPVLLLDEPTASLDREGQQVFFDLMTYLRRAGRTLVLASHRPEEVEALADRVLQLDGGRLVASSARAPRSSEEASRVIPFAPRAGHR